MLCRKRTKISDIIQYIIKQKWKRTGHTVRMQNNRWTQHRGATKVNPEKIKETTTQVAGDIARAETTWKDQEDDHSGGRWHSKGRNHLKRSRGRPLRMTQQGQEPPEKIQRMTTQKVAGWHSKGRNHLEQHSTRQTTMEGTDGGQHPAVYGQRLGSKRYAFHIMRIQASAGLCKRGPHRLDKSQFSSVRCTGNQTLGQQSYCLTHFIPQARNSRFEHNINFRFGVLSVEVTAPS